MFQAEANQRKQALETIGKRMNQSNEEKRGLENDYQCLLQRENVLKSALKTAEERCVYVDRFQELLSRYDALTQKYFSPFTVLWLRFMACL